MSGVAVDWLSICCLRDNEVISQ